jgi:membrane fusion protein, heavy metal efflux system
MFADILYKLCHSIDRKIANPDGNWRPGSLVHCTVEIEQHSAPLTVPASAIQTVDKSQVVFVRTTEGFEKRPIRLGQGDGRSCRR